MVNERVEKELDGALRVVDLVGPGVDKGDEFGSVPTNEHFGRETVLCRIDVRHQNRDPGSKPREKATISQRGVEGVQFGMLVSDRYVDDTILVAAGCHAVAELNDLFKATSLERVNERKLVPFVLIAAG